MTTWACDAAWCEGGVERDVVVVSGGDGIIEAVRVGIPAPPGARRLRGLVLPGFANAHSHAFHRALRGRLEASGGDFWRWREGMYSLVQRLDPERYRRLAEAVFAEMAMAGVTCVGEFHYLHHDVGGRPYEPANAMRDALVEAARVAGVRLSVLDTCYLTGGIGQALEGPQRRFGDGSPERWAERAFGTVPSEPYVRVGAAAHSVRALPPAALSAVAEAAAGRPLHVHVSEQPAENEACRSAYGMSPTKLLAECGVLGPATVAVHATHVDDEDVALLASHQSAVCLCPTTERDLGDGLGPTSEFTGTGVACCVGSDSHAVVDLLEEVRAVEMDERVRLGRRGVLDAEQLVELATVAGHRALGWPEAGRLAPGAPCDLVEIALDTVRTAGADLGLVPLVATAADVRTVVSQGRVVVEDGIHDRLGDVGRRLAEAVGEVWS
jgi:formiminoglutamate deiminase